MEYEYAEQRTEYIPRHKEVGEKDKEVLRGDCHSRNLRIVKERSLLCSSDDV
jgi:hypothetical protein